MLHDARPRRRPSPPGSPALNGAGGNACCFRGGGKHHVPTRGEPLLCCCYTCPAPRASASLLASLGICLLVLGYTLLGAFAFMALEGGLFSSTPVETAVAASKPNPGPTETRVGAEIRARTVDRLWSITEDLNILYKENWTRLAAQEVLEFQDALIRALRTGGARTRTTGGTTALLYYSPHDSHRWTFSSSFLYSLTLITTIGYGSVAPRTIWGRVVTIVYAVIGIPLMLVYLSTMGDALARSFRKIYARICHRQPRPMNHIPPDATKPPSYFRKDEELARSGVILDCGLDALAAAAADAARPSPRCLQHGCPGAVRVPVLLCVFIIMVYIAAGAFLFNRIENWTLLEGSYFCFTSLGTIGFGDLVPGQGGREISHCACSAYILIGMALVAMCFNLVQLEVASAVRALSRLCGAPAHPQRHLHPCPEEIAMAVVSSS